MEDNDLKHIWIGQPIFFEEDRTEVNKNRGTSEQEWTWVKNQISICFSYLTSTEKLVEDATSSPDLNAFENLWHKLKEFLRWEVKSQVNERFIQCIKLAIDNQAATSMYYWSLLTTLFVIFFVQAIFRATTFTIAFLDQTSLYQYLLIINK